MSVLVAKPQAVAVIILIQNIQERSECLRYLRSQGFHVGTDFNVFQYVENVENELRRSRKKQLVVLSAIGGSSRASDHFAKGLRTHSGNFKCVWFGDRRSSSEFGMDECPYNGFIRPDPNFPYKGIADHMRTFLL